MPVDISVESDLKALRRGLSSLEKQAVPQATVRTLNWVAESTKSASTRHIAPQIGGRQAAVKRSIETRKFTVRRLWAELAASERPLRLIEFVVGSKKPTQQPGGKRGLVKVKRHGARRKPIAAPSSRRARRVRVRQRCICVNRGSGCR